MEKVKPPHTIFQIVYQMAGSSSADVRAELFVQTITFTTSSGI